MTIEILALTFIIAVLAVGFWELVSAIKEVSNGVARIREVLLKPVNCRLMPLEPAKVETKVNVEAPLTTEEIVNAIDTIQGLCNAALDTSRAYLDGEELGKWRRRAEKATTALADIERRAKESDQIDPVGVMLYLQKLASRTLASLDVISDDECLICGRQGLTGKGYADRVCDTCRDTPRSSP